jgi:hypothetical protein
MSWNCRTCGQENWEFFTFCNWCKHDRPLSSDSEQIPKPPTREGGGDRVERFDGLHASEASGGSHE